MDQKPTVGRIVHFYAAETAKKGQPYPAVITHVWSDECVNLQVCPDGSFPFEGSPYPTSVMLAKDPTNLQNVWSWPPRS